MANKPTRKYVMKGDVLNSNDKYFQRIRPKPHVKPKTNLLISLIVFASVLIVYFITQNRSVAFWDVGEYIACSSILGVPHPPGNPFYIILGRAATILGFGLPDAVVVNGLSGIMSAFAVMFTYLFTVKLVSMFEENKSLIITAGIIAALYNAFSYTFWNNAVEASVYPGRDLVINSTLYLTLLWVEKSRNFSHQNLFLLITYIFFLGFSIHQTSLQTIPAVALVILYPILMISIKTTKFWAMASLYLVVSLVLYFIFIEVGREHDIPDLPKIVIAIFLFVITYVHMRHKVPTKIWVLGLVFIFLALSPHFYLLIRSRLRPFINEGDPHNLELFSDYILRRQYGVVSFMERRASAWYQVSYHFLRYLFWQFFHADTIAGWIRMPSATIAAMARIIVVFLGLSGIWYQIKKNKHSFIYLFAFFFMSSVAMIVVMNLSDAEVRDRDYFFVSAYYLWGVWMAIGSLGLVKLIAGNYKKLMIPLMSLFLLLPIINFSSQYFIHDRSREFIALDYGLNFLNSLEENAIIFTNGDNDTFPLWYAQAVKDPRAFEHIYPATDVNPTREARAAIREAVERKENELSGVRPDVTVANLSLLNTPWYIRHLRDIEGVQFNVPDEFIDEMGPMRSPRHRQMKITSPDGEESFTIDIPANKIMLIKDIAAIQIIRDNFGSRPIYMAVTVADEIVFHDFLRNEGIVNRIVPTKEPDQADIERLKHNLENIYSYRSIFEDDIYKDDNMKNLITNYGAAYMRVSQHYHRRGELTKAADYLAEAIEFIRDSERFYPSVVQMYIDAQETIRALYYIDKVLQDEPQNLGMYLQAVNIHIKEDNPDKAFEVFDRAIENRVTASELSYYIYLTAEQFGKNDKGINYLERIREYDDRPQIQEYIDDLDSAANSWE